jgi:arylformamidase
VTSADGADWHEREYNPRLTVADAGDLISAWSARSDATRRAHPPLRDIRTGDHPREVLDLFRPDSPRGVVVYIHGGYRRSFSKSETAFVAEGFLGAGLSVALLNYPLCPEVALETLIESVRRSFAHLVRDVLTDAERTAVVVTGHSAGGYLTAALVATDWTARGLPAYPFHGAVPISGVFDLAPLVHTSMNEQIRLTPERARGLNLLAAPQQVLAPVVVAVGGAETPEFHRQSRALTEAWTSPRPTLLEVDGANHFTVLDALATPGTPLNAAVTAMADATLAGRAADR